MGVVYVFGDYFVSTVVYNLLVKARIVSGDFNALQLKSVWFRCQALFIRFIEAAMKQADNVRYIFYGDRSTLI